MIRRIADRPAFYLSANRPVLWAVRLDIALLLAPALLVVGLATILVGTTLLERYLGDTRRETALQLVIVANGLLFLSALVLWNSAIGRARYSAISPRMIGYPRYIDFFLVALPLSLIYAFIIWIAFVAFGEGVVFDHWWAFPIAGLAAVVNIVISAVLYIIFDSSFKIMILTLLASTFVIIVLIYIFSGPSFIDPYLSVKGGADVEVLGVIAILWGFLLYKYGRSGYTSKFSSYIIYALILIAPISIVYIFAKSLDILSLAPSENPATLETVRAELYGFILLTVYCAATVLIIHSISRRVARTKVRPA